MKNKSIAICTFRIGKTDGVSLEIKKRKKVLEEMGYKVYLVAGPSPEKCDFLIPLLDFERPDIHKVRHNAFEKFEDFKSNSEFEKYISGISDKIKSGFLEIHSKVKFDYLFIHNIFTHGRHIAAAKAFFEIADETDINLISVNHDFYWTGSYREFYKPQTDFVNKFLDKYVPPKLPNITHVVINSISQKALKDRIDEDSILLPDTFDFAQKQWVEDDYNKDFLSKLGIGKNDLFILQATRITKRKAIEVAIDLVAQLEKRKKLLIGKKLYNGKVLTENSEIYFVLAGYAERDSLNYKKSLEEIIKEKKVKALFINNYIAAERHTENSGKLYSLWDAYVYADLVTFPSVWEGWGNQFIEAVFAKKPVVLFEYPVFKADITKEGYKVISLGNETLIRDGNNLVKVPEKNLDLAVAGIIKMLTDTKTNKILDQNYAAGEKYHSDEFLKKKLVEMLNAADKNSKLR